MKKALMIVLAVLAVAAGACVPTPGRQVVTVLVTQPPQATYTPYPTYTPPPTYTAAPPLPTYTSLPTHTALPPVPTSTPMPTQPPAATQTPASTPTSAPTATVPCSRPVGDRFSGIWAAIQKRVDSAPLGCPLNDPHVVKGAAQEFQNGYMLWRNDNQQILVLYTDGRAASFPDTFQAGTDPDNGGYQAPSGFVEPRSGFGKVWREQLGGPSSEIGWAKGGEYVTKNLMAQDFENGVVFWEDFVGNRVYLANSGRWEQW